jgi:hypothetical protein
VDRVYEIELGFFESARENVKVVKLHPDIEIILNKILFMPSNMWVINSSIYRLCNSTYSASRPAY